jgi:hypothetical protein
MLVQFSVENFLSFKEEVTFSMLAAKKGNHADHIVKEGEGKMPLLHTAAIYGANASGKSNLVTAIAFARELIVRGTRSGQMISVTPFKLDEDCLKKTSAFEFVIKTGRVIYTYGFKLNSKKVLEEWLFAKPAKRDVRYFERVTSGKDKVRVEFGPSFISKGAKGKQFLEFVAQGTRPNQLFLTEAIERNVKELKSLMDWFRDVLVVIPAGAKHLALELTIHKDESFTKFLGDFLATAGTGVQGIATEEEPLDFDKHFPDIPDDIREDVVSVGEGAGLALRTPDGEHYNIVRGKQGQPMLVLLKTQHRTKDGRLTSFDVREESDGTQRLMHLAPALYSLRTSETVLIIDELDRRLHPLMSKMFLEAVIGSKDANQTWQFIFTTHDTNLLDIDLLRRDEIWFVEKDDFGASHMYSLAEFKIRPDLKIQKGYLNGRFGAIPFIGDLSRLGLSE